MVYLIINSSNDTSAPIVTMANFSTQFKKGNYSMMQMRIYCQLWIRIIIYQALILSDKRTVSQESSILRDPSKRCPVVPSVHVQTLVLKSFRMWIPNVPVPVNREAYCSANCLTYPSLSYLALLSPCLPFVRPPMR